MIFQLIIWIIFIYISFSPSIIAYAINIKHWKLLVILNIVGWFYLMDFILELSK
jgi:hypothetical protein